VFNFVNFVNKFNSGRSAGGSGRGGTRRLVGLTVAFVVVLSSSVAAAATRTSASSGRAVAVRDVASLLTRLRLPAGAVPSSGPPVGAGAALVAPGIVPATPDVATQTTYWTVPGTPADVLAYVAANPPAGGHQTLSGSASDHGVVTATFEGFTFPSTAVLDPRVLGLTAVATSPTTTALLVEAADVWLIARPASERVPATARVVVVSVIPPLGQSGRKRAPTRRIRVTDHGRVARLIAAVNAAPPAQPGDTSCPADNGAGLTLAFRATAGGPNLAVARVSSNGCGDVAFTLGGRVQPPLADGSGLTATADRILGIRAASA
jgi:hypothetical protein